MSHPPLAAPRLRRRAACLIPVLVALALLAVPGPEPAAAASATAKPKSATASAHGRPARRALRFHIRRANVARPCRPRVQRARADRHRRARARVTRPQRKGKRARRTSRRRARGARSCASEVEPTDSVGPVSRANLRIGLVANTQIQGENAGGEQDVARQTGAGWLREEFDWDAIEPQDDRWDWTRYDAVIEQAAFRGLRILPLLNGSASWAAPRWNQFPDDLSEYGEYVAHVTERYGPGGTFWDARPQLADYAPTHFELWNEPYIEYFSSDKVSPARYAELAKVGAAAGRAANPRANFLLSADTFYTESPGDYRNWIDGMYDAVPDLNSYFDAVAVHPYSANLSPDIYTPGEGTRWQFRRIEEMRARFVAHGAADKKFWITEVGWATCAADHDCVSEQQQAEYLSRVFAYVRGDYAPFMEAVFVYHMSDWGPADEGNKEYWFGLQRKDGSRKPAFDALRHAAGIA